MRGRKPREVATQEAFEEAGLLGTIVGEHRIGRRCRPSNAARPRMSRCRYGNFEATITSATAFLYAASVLLFTRRLARAV